MTSVGSHAADSHDAASTALRGASLAFQKKPAPPPPKKDNGALTAATSAGQSASRSPARPLGPQSTGSGNGLLAPETPQLHAHTTGGTDRLMPTKPAGPGSSPSPSVKVDTKSPSFIAATLAASRSASPTPKPRGQPRTQSGPPASPATPEAVDSMSIAPMGSLISMFERGREGDPVKRRSPTRVDASLIVEEPVPTKPQEPATKPLVSTKPPVSVPVKPKEPMPKPQEPAIKPQSRVMLAKPQELATKPQAKAAPTKPQEPATRPQVRAAPPAKAAKEKAATEKPEPPKADTERARPPKPKPKPRPITPPAIISRSEPELVSPKPRRVLKPPSAPQPIVTKAPPSVSRPVQTRAENVQPPAPSQARPPTPPKPRRSKAVQLDGYFPEARKPRPRAASNSSDDTFVSASSGQSPSRPALPARAVASAPSSPVRETPSLTPRPMRHANASSSTLPLESLTTAIVAGSLASANLTPHHTGSLPAPPLPKRQKSPRLLQTLRQPRVESDDESDRHKKSHLRKLRGGNKHSHHEGSRKRWREEIRPRERKRYEAVWASNRGLLLSRHVGEPLDTAQYVANVVVREIWKRSRLPDDELAEVWDLVDRQRRGMLSRQEFVVGMWLIDQRLRGRKIPHRVSESVWGSANGVHVSKPKVKR